MTGKSHTRKDLMAEIQSLRTRLEEAEETLRVIRSEDKYRQLFELESDSLFLIDSETNEIIEANAAASALYGYTKKELQSLKNTDLSAEPDRTREATIGKSLHIPIRWHRKKNGTVFPVEITASHFTWMGRSVHIAAIRDITERKKTMEMEIAKEAAEACSKAKSDFLANMSHELRTPLNSILGFSEMLEDGMLGELDEKKKRCVAYIHSAGQHLLSLITDILDLSKVESGKMELKVTEFPLRSVLNSAVAMFKEKAVKQRITLGLEIGPDANISIEADERRLKQIMYNLLSNALKFTPDGGSVAVRARMAQKRGSAEDKGPLTSGLPGFRASDLVEISVGDTGIGIRREDMPKLFTEFTQINSPYAKKYEGTGLGLALTKRLVELHGGSIWAKSEFGKGSTFTLLLPVKQNVIL